MSDKQKEETIRDLEEQIKKKQKELESPFAVAGADNPRPRGRPAKQANLSTLTGDLPDGAEAAKLAHSQRMNEVPKPPPNSNPESLRDWAEGQIHNLLPEAVASLAWDIKYGDGKARTEARGEILRATGIDKRDAVNFGKGGQIVINVGGNGPVNDIQLPYLKRSPQPSSPVISTLEDKITKKE